MRSAARLAVAGLAAGAIIMLAPLPAGACTCVARDLPAQVRAASAVFIGTVRDAGPNASVFHVDRRYKGSAVGDVSLAFPSDGCAIPFTPGREYLVFATALPTGAAPGSALTTDLCAGTTDDLGVVSQLAAAGLPSNPRADAPEVPRSHRIASRALPIAAAGALVVVLGVATTLAAHNAAVARVARRSL